ncbi:MAG: 3-hydroxyacyl-ACP dehydratase FabZ family protein [Phycisphaerae bacterium]|nr:3-hydroxyacyl-ACP dehydratase FabZ family protein [Tepidisphaeraceae bacterium]
MPAQILFDISAIDLNQTAFDEAAILDANPQRGEMKHLDRIVWADAERGEIIGVKEVKEDEFWVPGHIPGRPLLPGVVMIEAGAQLSSFYAKKVLGWTGFLGFGGCDEVRFRAQVPPGKRMYILGKKLWVRRTIFASAVQGIVDGNICFDAKITGAIL